jgi:hypothetical protein
MKVSLAGFLCWLSLWACSTALAHHSPAVFDRTREVTITGVVTEFRWGNPHCWIHLSVTNDRDEAEMWSVEMNPASLLRRAGWTASTVKPGDEVSIRAYPLRNDEKGGQYISITLPGGKVMDER